MSGVGRRERAMTQMEKPREPDAVDRVCLLYSAGERALDWCAFTRFWVRCGLKCAAVLSSDIGESSLKFEK